MIGSLISSLYASDLEGSLSGLPAQAQAGAEESVGAAGAVAAQLPPEAASRLLSAAGEAFTQAMATGLLPAAALAAVTAVVVARYLPARGRGAKREPLSLTAAGRGASEAKAAS